MIIYLYISIDWLVVIYAFVFIYLSIYFLRKHTEPIIINCNILSINLNLTLNGIVLSTPITIRLRYGDDERMEWVGSFTLGKEFVKLLKNNISSAIILMIYLLISLSATLRVF